MKAELRAVLKPDVLAASPNSDRSVILLPDLYEWELLIWLSSVTRFPKILVQQTHFKLPVILCTFLKWRSKLDVEMNSVPQWPHLNFGRERIGSFYVDSEYVDIGFFSRQKVYSNLRNDASCFRKSPFF